MGYEFDHATADLLWPALLECREFLRDPRAESTPAVFFARRGDIWTFGARDPSREPDVDHTLLVPLTSEAEPAPDTGVRGSSVFDYGRFRTGRPPLEHLSGASIGTTAATIFRVYLPLLLGTLAARRRATVFVVAHIAQTLDGRIACRNGHSRWISNHANLVHSHRLRALHDAVLVGSGTVASDDPQLTVRHVRGTDPRRVVLSGSASVLRDSPRARLFSGAGAMLLCSERAAATSGQAPGSVEVVAVPSANGSNVSSDDVCRALAGRGAFGVFLEGGAKTVSRFLADGRIDVLHVHVAPMILGSGISSFSLPEVATVQEGRTFRMQHFAMDGEVLFECRELGSGESSG